MTPYVQLFNTITSDPRYAEHLEWGYPRPGHPEGTIRAHIEELERNLDRLRPRLNEELYWKLRVLIHVHDAFKGVAQQGVPIADPSSHASLARQFLAEFTTDSELLNIVQWHDEPYALYLQFKSRGTVNQPRLNALFETIRDWDLFVAFQIIDNCTAGKSRDPLLWLFTQLNGEVETLFSAQDILP